MSQNRVNTTGTFDQLNTSATNLYTQAQGQLDQATSLLGTMGTSIVDQAYNRASGLYTQATTFLGFATTSADQGKVVTNAMASSANTPTQNSIVTQLNDTYTNIKTGIADAYNNAGTLFTQLQTKQTQTQTELSETVTVTSTLAATQLRALPDDSAGAIVKSQQDANAERADVQNPSIPQIVIVGDSVGTASQASSSTNATRPVLSDNASLGPNGQVNTNVAALAQSIQGGIAAAGDDWINYGLSTLGVTSSVGDGARPVIPAGFTAPIVPQPNKLASLASQTYSISIYITSKTENDAILNGQKVVFPANSLLIQSGGINSSTVENQRNQYFDVDFYIDDVEITSLVGTQGVGAAHNVTKMKLRIQEPNGITLINRLDKAVREYSKIGNAPITGIMQNYCMIIRFYGYDQDGNLVSGEQLGISRASFGTDRNAISEKWIPFTIGEIQYQIGSKGVEYDVTAVVTQANTMFSDKFGGGIPFNFELVASDLKTLFNGSVKYSQETTDDDTIPQDGTTNSTSSPKADASATPTVTQGLAAALNAHQQDLVKNGQQEIADEYEIQLYNLPGLIDATLNTQGRQDKSRAPMEMLKNAANRLLGSKQSYDKNTKNYNITAGTQVAQLIDLAVRASSFITNQQTIVYDQNQQPIQQQPTATTMWFRIQGSALPLGYDRKRRNTAYRFKYLVTPYQINDPRSPYFSTARYRGVHKVYNYWFTGQNTEVLDFVIDVNSNYAQTVGVDTQVSTWFSGRWAEKRVFQTRPGESSQGGSGTSTMPAATLAERLYSAEDVMKCELSIVGDPDWIIQSEIFYLNPTFDAFMPDGSVNAAGSEVLYEVRFNAPTDFNLGTGLTPVYRNNTSYSNATGESNIAAESIVYSANEVKTSLKGGKFTQRLSGTLKNFEEDARNSAAGNTSPTVNTGAATGNAAAATTSPDMSVDMLDYLDGGLFAPRGNGGTITGTTTPTGTGTPVAQSNNPVQVDANNRAISSSLPVGRPGSPSWNFANRVSVGTTASAPSDDAGGHGF
jgi:hypothetical protein